ncbi:MAG: DUF481 domain-containing protein [Gammaproteobacteria bacterium]|nr:DUF481 domain-containing protein [Gammaproteobacteria bacterium]
MHKKMAAAVISGLMLANAGLVTADPLKGDGELGYTSTTGNTHNKNLNAKLSLSKKDGLWRHKGKLEALGSTTDSVTTAERYLLTAKTTRDFTEKSYGFGDFRYENDRFSGYDYQATLAGGVGKRFIEDAVQTVDASAGLGINSNQNSVTGKSEQQGILMLKGNYLRNVSPSAVFTEDLSVESGSKNTYVESVTGLKMTIIGALASKLSFTIKRNSSVPAGTSKTDTLSAVTLVYSF